MSFPRYPAYKDSGVTWFESLPSHWQVKRLGFSCDTLVPMRDKPDLLDGDIPWIRIEDFQGKYLASSKSGQGVSQATVDAMHLKVLPAGTVLCSCSCSMGATAIVSAPLVTNQTFIGIVPGDGISADYLYYFFQASSDYLNSIGTGAIQTYLSRDDFRQLRLPSPPDDEQLCIASFLDQETAKIDALVAEQERLIELLKEKRQAVISHAVTKGLNPSVPMKDSGVEWLGEVPAHWETTRLKHATELIVDCPHETPIYSDDGDHLVIRTADIFDGVLREDGLYRVSEKEYSNRVRRQSLLQGDVVYSREGERWGHAALVPRSDTFCLGQRMMQFRVAKHFDPEYMMWLLNSEVVYRQGQQDTVGATSPHVNVGTIRNYALCSPPLEEQQRIGMHLSAKACEFDALIEDATVAVDLLTERRTALISAAVTGQIDVRGWAPAKAAH